MLYLAYSLIVRSGLAITANTVNDNNKFQFHYILSYIPKLVQLISLRMAGSLLLAELLLLVKEGQAVTSESLGK